MHIYYIYFKIRFPDLCALTILNLCLLPLMYLFNCIQFNKNNIIHKVKKKIEFEFALKLHGVRLYPNKNLTFLDSAFWVHSWVKNRRLKVQLFISGLIYLGFAKKMHISTFRCSQQVPPFFPFIKTIM